MAAGSDEKAELKEVDIKKLFTFYVNPEWKGPEQDHDDPDMWNWQGAESMHPYWSIRRLTQQRLGEATFNMQLTPVSFTTLVVGALSGVSTSVSMEVIVPFLTNSVEIPEGRVAAGGGRQAEETTTEAKDLERSCPRPQWRRRWK